MTEPCVVAVSRDDVHRFSKTPVEEIELVAGLGVQGDAHAGTLVQHRSRVRRDPNQPNLRQVHLVPAELFELAKRMGYSLAAGDLGENVLTSGVDLHALPVDTRLHLGDEAVVRITGLRNPCAQINDFKPGLLKVVLAKADGTPTDQPAPSTASPEAGTVQVIRRAGVMSVVERSGTVRACDQIGVELPDGERFDLAPV